MRHNKVSELEVENENKKDIKNPSHYSFLSQGGLQHLLSIFNKHNFWLWDYVIDA